MISLIKVILGVETMTSQFRLLLACFPAEGHSKRFFVEAPLRTIFVQATGQGTLAFRD